MPVVKPGFAKLPSISLRSDRRRALFRGSITIPYLCAMHSIEITRLEHGGTDEFKGSPRVSARNTCADWYYTIISLRFFPPVSPRDPGPRHRCSFDYTPGPPSTLDGRSPRFPFISGVHSKFADEVKDRSGWKGIAGQLGI